MHRMLSRKAVLLTLLFLSLFLSGLSWHLFGLSELPLEQRLLLLLAGEPSSFFMLCFKKSFFFRGGGLFFFMKEAYPQLSTYGRKIITSTFL